MSETDRLRVLVRWLALVLAVYVPLSLGLIAYAIHEAHATWDLILKLQSQTDQEFASLALDPEGYFRRVQEFDAKLRKGIEKVQRDMEVWRAREAAKATAE